MDENVHEAIRRIYDTLQNQARWPSVLDEFVDRVNAQGSIVFEWRHSDDEKLLTAPLFSGFYSHDILKTYLNKNAHLEAKDQEVLRELTGDHDEVEFFDDTVLAKSRTDLEHDEHVQKLKRLGIFHRAAGVLNKDNRWISLFSVQLNVARQPLTGEERHYMQQLLPHFAKALDLGIPMRQLAAERQGALAAIDHLTIGICVLDPQGNIVLKNEEFRRQLDAFGVFEISPGGALGLAEHDDQKRFAELKASVRNHGKFGARPRKEALAAAADSYLCIELAPLNHVDEMGAKLFGGYIVYSTDTSRPVTCNPAPMQGAFGLTDAEMSLVEAIGQGWTNPEIAEHRDRSISTINAQVKSILSKSQCATRTQFVRMMMRFGGSYLRSAK